MDKFCPRCVARLEWQDVRGKRRLLCPNGDYVNWSHERISVGGIVKKGKQVLLVQRAEDPGKGMWTIPGGFAEQDETIAVAIQREIKEEAGISTRVGAITMLAELPGANWHDIYVVFTLDYLSGKLKQQREEVRALKFCTVDEALHLPLADLTRQILSHCSDKHFKRLPIRPAAANGFHLYG